MAAGSGTVELWASPDFSTPDWADYPLPPGVATSALGWRVWVGEALPDIDAPPDLLQLPERLRQTLDQPSNGSTGVSSASIPNTPLSH